MDKLIKSLSLGLVLLFLAGCDNGDTDLEESINEQGFYARFDPSNSVLPSPNNLLFTNSGDGTLNIPVVNENDFSDPKVAMNTLDGFSTTAPLTAQFSSAIDADSVIPGKTVRVFKVNANLLEVIRELTPGQDYTATLSSADPYDTTLAILPMRPLTPQSTYVVVLTRGIKGKYGDSAGTELPYALAKSNTPLTDASGVSLYLALSDADAQALEPLRQVTNITEGTVENFSTVLDTDQVVPDIAKQDIVLSWSFRTQSVRGVLDSALDIIDSSIPHITASKTDYDTGLIVSGSPGAALIYTGTLDTDYFLTTASPNITAPLYEFWHNSSNSFPTPLNSTPVPTGIKTMPVLITVPKTPAGSNGWPVVIFQHGITRNRTDLLAIADSLAAAGFVGIAIDLPLHGITDTTNPFYDASNENTFNLDFVNTDGVPGPDGLIDDSGTHFINLSNLLVTRDNVRQSVVDLAALYKSLPQLDADVFAGELDTDHTYFIGHSLGGIVGSVFLRYFDGSATAHGDIKDAVLAMPGGGIAKLLDGSATFGTVIASGLAQHNLIKGTQDYESYMGAAQTIIDPVDPLNYAADYVTDTNQGVLLFEVIGGTGTISDQVIPNNVLPDSTPGTVPSLLAGTDPMASLMGLTIWNGLDPAPGTNLKAWIRFNAGHHGSLLTPNDAYGIPDDISKEVFLEMQSEAVSFLLNNGNKVNTFNTNVLSTE